MTMSKSQLPLRDHLFVQCWKRGKDYPEINAITNKESLFFKSVKCVKYAFL